MGLRKRTNEKTSARLAVKKETLRALNTLTDDELRAAAGGQGTAGTTRCLPSCNGC